MIKIEPYRIVLDLKRNKTLQTNIKINQADIGKKLIIEISDDGRRFQKEDYENYPMGIFVSNINGFNHQGVLENKEDCFIYTFASGDLRPGYALAMVRLYNKDLNSDTAVYFTYYVDDDIITEEDIESTSEYDTFIAMAEEMKDKLESFPKLVILGEFNSYDELVSTYPEGTSEGGFVIQGRFFYWAVKDKKWIDFGTINESKPLSEMVDGESIKVVDGKLSLGFATIDCGIF